MVYAVYTLRKVQLTPLQQGMLSLGKAFVNNLIEVLNPENPFEPKKYNITVSNAEESVEVNPLPEKNKPKIFMVSPVFSAYRQRPPGIRSLLVKTGSSLLQ
jgi:hypothetical protein